MTIATYSVREAKARFSEILRGLEAGDEAIITRHGKPCGRLIPIDAADEPTAARSPRGSLAGILPHADLEDFTAIRRETGRIAPNEAPTSEKPSLRTLRDAFADRLPDVEYEEFRKIREDAGRVRDLPDD